MKTGRMAPVKGQLTDGALTPSEGMCVHANVSTETAPPLFKTPHREVKRYKNSNKESKMEEITESLQKIKQNQRQSLTGYKRKLPWRFGEPTPV